MRRYAPIFIPGVYIAGLVLVNIIAVVYIVMSGIDPFDTASMEMIRFNSLINLGFYVFAFIVIGALFHTLWRDELRQFWHNRKQQLTIVAIGTVAMLGAMIALSLITTLLGYTETPENQEILNMQLEGPLFDRITLILFSVLFAPVVEELVFRYAGFRIVGYIKGLPKWVPVVVTALVFGAIHLVAGEWMPIIYYAGLGVVLGVIYLKSTNIMTPILVHMLFNGFVTLTMFLPVLE